MPKLIPKGYQIKEESSPLEIDEVKRGNMKVKAKELLDKPMEKKELIEKLENYYIFELNEHYTSEQLCMIANDLFIELNTCDVCGKYPCECPKEKIGPEFENEEEEVNKKIKVKKE